MSQYDGNILKPQLIDKNIIEAFKHRTILSS